MSESKDRSENTGKSQLTLAEMKAILDRKGKDKLADVSEAFDVSTTTIWRIWNGKIKKLEENIAEYRKSLLTKLCKFFIDEDTDSALKEHILANAKMEKLTASMGAEEIQAFEEALL